MSNNQLPADKQQPKWEVKEWGEESYAITNGKATLVTSDASDDGYLSAVVDLLNASGYRFHSESKIEIDLHCETEMYKLELSQWKDRAQVLVDALEAFILWQGPTLANWPVMKQAHEALQQWKDRKEVDDPVQEIEYMPIHPDDATKFDCPKQFPMHLLNEDQAQINHGQTLQRLKERGGLSVREILAIVNRKRWSYYEYLQWTEALAMLNDILANTTK